MPIPTVQKARLAAYVLRQLPRGIRFPLVLMLEPLFRCNLRCRGCGKIAQSREVEDRMLSVEECLAAAEECGAPVVSIPGGEPLLHPDIHHIVEGLTARKKFVYLCTNGLLVHKKIHAFRPSAYLTFSIHLDGLAERHDAQVCRPGVFERAAAAIRLLKARGFRVTTNTTLFAGDTPEEAAKLFDFLTSLGVEALTVSPGFSYKKARDQENFLEKEATETLFRQLFAMNRGRRWPFNHSSLYLDFLAGNQQYCCTPWGNPTRNILGWQRPCYLLNDGYAGSFRELLETTPWERYGRGKDPRCSNCMVHCGFEPTAVLDTIRNPLKALRVAVRGVKPARPSSRRLAVGPSRLH